MPLGRSLVVVMLALLMLAPAAWASTGHGPTPVSGFCAVQGVTIPPDRLFFPNVTRTLGGPDGWETPFIIQNVGGSTTVLQIYFNATFDPNGQPPVIVAEQCISNVVLEPGRTYAVVPRDVAGLPDDTAWAVTVLSYGSKVIGVVNEQRGAGDSAEAMSYSGVTSGSTRVFLPNVADDYFGYTTPIIVQNVSPDGVSDATATFVSFDGSASTAVTLPRLAPFQRTVIDPGAAPGFVRGMQYSGTITATRPVAVVQNSSRLSGGPHVSSSYNGLSAGASRLWAPYVTIARSAPDGVSPIVIENVGSAATTPQVSVYVNAPTASLPQCALGVCTYTFTGPVLAPARSWAFDPRDHLCSTLGTPATCLPGGTLAGAKIESGQSVGAGATWTFDPTARLAAVVLPTSDTTAMAYQAREASTRAFLPNVTRRLGGDRGWTTPIRLIGTGSAILRWYRFSDGALAATSEVVIGPESPRAVTVDPRDVPELADGGQYSVVIADSTGASGGTPFAAAVTEFAAGGDNAMAYEGFTLAGDAVAPLGIRDPIAFAAACPTMDPAYPLIAADVTILVDGSPAPAPACAVDDARTRTLQALVVAYHMERGRSAPYPWTSSPLYDWMRTRLAGFDIRADAETSWCCETLARGSYAVLAKQAVLERSWSGVSSWLALMAHEVRHNGGPGHVDCVTPPIAGGCDASYDETNISSYGIQYWLNRAWLEGGLNVGLGCLPAADRFALATVHLRNVERFRARFAGGRTPDVAMPQAAGGPCLPP